MLLSGYLSDDLTQTTHAAGAVRMIAKEFAVEQLMQVVNEILERPRRAS